METLSKGQSWKMTIIFWSIAKTKALFSLHQGSAN